MNSTLFIQKWVDEEEKFEAKVLENIMALKKLRKFQDSDEYWDLIDSCWKYKEHVDRKQVAFKKRFSKIDLISSIDKSIPIHAKKRKVTNAFYVYASSMIEELKTSSEREQEKWQQSAEQIGIKTKLNSVYKLWSDIYIWQDEDIVPNIFTHMGVYNNEINTLGNTIRTMCKLTGSDSEYIIKYLMNQFAKKNKELFKLNPDMKNES